MEEPDQPKPTTATSVQDTPNSASNQTVDPIAASPSVNKTTTGSMEYSGFGRRLVAAIIDGVLEAIVVILLLQLIPVLAGVYQNESPNLFSFFLVLILLFMAAILFYPTFMIGKYGATIGKMIVKIKVVDQNNQKPSWGTAIMRETVGKFVSGFIPFYIGHLWMLWDEKKQTIHDKIASTYVINTR